MIPEDQEHTAEQELPPMCACGSMQHIVGELAIDRVALEREQPGHTCPPGTKFSRKLCLSCVSLISSMLARLNEVAQRRLLDEHDEIVQRAEEAMGKSRGS